MSKWWRAGCLGCLLAVLLGSVALGSCVGCFFQSTQREPELAVEQFLRKQLEAFPLSWTPGWTPGKLLIHTDSDVTWASWAVITSFLYKNGLDSAGEEVHVFANSFAARILFRTTPRLSSSLGYQTYVPAGWAYRPPRAQQFEIKCIGRDSNSQREVCEFVVRYEEYVIVFHTPIASYMTLDDLRQILEVIDREMTNYLQSSTLHPGPRPVPTRLEE